MTIEIAGYSILRELGRGGMATVYLAVQESLNREVALKVIAEHLANRPNYRERFLREGRIAASFHHRHIVAIHDVGTRGERVYMAMEYLPRGAAIAEVGQLGLQDALRLVREIAGALDYAHGRGIVHRDVKPENILRHEDGAWLLSDFGIAHSEAIPTIVTGEGVTVGSPHYMSPEQWRSRNPDGRSDLYSLGVVLYQMLTGNLPYAGGDAWAIGMQHISGPVPTLPPNYAALQGLLDILMAKDLSHRVSSATEVVHRVEQIERQHPLTVTLPVRLPAAPLAAAVGGAKGRWLALLALGLVSLTTFGLLAWQQGRQNDSAATVAEANIAQAVAVLPFRSLDSDSESDGGFFADGLADELITSLATVDGLAVAARASSFALRDSKLDMASIGRLLRVGFVLEASVRRSAGQVRIGARLVDTASGFNVWAETYDRSLDDVFKVQAEIAAAVATAITGVRAAAQDAPLALAPPSRRVDAFEHFLRARGLLNAGRTAEALGAFRAALAVDPAYARAQAGICHTEIRRYVERLDPTARARAERDCARAKAMDSELRDVDLALGDLARADVKLEDALAAYTRAAEDATLRPEALTGKAQALAQLGRVDEARQYFEQAVALQPGYWRILHRFGNFELALGRHAAAITLYRRALKQPGAARPRTLNNLGSAYMLVGDFDLAAEAFTAALAEEPTQNVLSNLGTLMFYLERHAEAVEHFRGALLLAPDDYVLWGNLGDALAIDPAQSAAAGAAYQKALDKGNAFLAANPKDATALAMMAWFAINLDRRADAERWIAEATAQDPDSAMIMFQSALVLGRLGAADAAQRDLRRAAELGYPERVVRNAARLYRLSDVALVSGEKQKASQR